MGGLSSHRSDRKRDGHGQRPMITRESGLETERETHTKRETRKYALLDLMRRLWPDTFLQVLHGRSGGKFMASERFCYFGPQRLLRHINDLGRQRLSKTSNLKSTSLITFVPVVLMASKLTLTNQTEKEEEREA